jgi:tetratricopeptide (TPR) repeat protein
MSVTEEAISHLQVALSDRYRIAHELGSGGMATVYLAEDLKHHRQVAIKVLKPELAASLGAERFLREIEIAAQLSHPNILTLIDSGTADGLLYYVMSYVEGESLRDRLKREKQLSIEDALQITSEVADALGYAHSLGIVHRDVKPENILFEAGHAVVTDFGIAKAVTDAGAATLTETGLAVGTPAYMSPEQAGGVKDIDARSDVYALGCVLFEMLGGEPPFTGVTPQAILARKSVEAVPSVRAVRDTVPDSVDLALTKALAKVPADRFMTVSRFVEALSAPVVPLKGLDAGGLLALVGIYAAGSLLVLALVYLIVEQLGLPYWVLTAAAVLMVAFLPITMITGSVERQRALAEQTGRRAAMPRSRMLRGLSWRRTGSTIVLALVLLGVVVSGYSAMRVLGIGPVSTLMAAGLLPERSRIIVTDFENRTGDSALGVTITEMLRMALARSPVAEPLSYPAVVAALRYMELDPTTRVHLPLALEMAERDGVPAIVAGAVSSIGTGYVISAQLIAAADTAALWGAQRTVSGGDQLIAAVNDLSREMRVRMGESLRSVRQTDRLLRVSTQSMPALRKYTQSVREWASTGEWERSGELLEEAVAIDSTFAVAYSLLAIRYSQEGRWSEWLTAIDRSFRYKEQLPERDRLFVELNYYDYIEPDRDKAIALQESFLEDHPEDQDLLNLLSDTYLQSRDWELAERYAREGTDLKPIRNPYLVWNLAEALAGQGRYADAEQAVFLLEGDLPDHSIRWALLARLASTQRDYERAAMWLDSLREVRPRDWLARRAVYAMARGQFAEAAGYMRELITMLDQPHRRLRWLINIARATAWRGDTAAALRQIEQALEQYPLESLHPADRPYLRLAAVYAHTGNADRAREYKEEFRESVHEVVQQRQASAAAAAEGAISFAEGEYPQAAASFQRSYDLTKCAVCNLYQLGRSYEMAGELDSALAVYERAVYTPGLFRAPEEYLTLGPTYRRLAALYEQRGDRENAIEFYNRFIELWENADPELQPRVQEARERLALLMAEPQQVM